MSDHSTPERPYPPYVTTDRELREREGDIRNHQARPPDQGGAGELRGPDTEPDVRQQPAVAMSEEAHNQQLDSRRKGFPSGAP